MVGKIKKQHIFSTEKPNKTLPSGYIFQNEHALSHSHNKALLWVSLIGVRFTLYIFEADTDYRYFGDQIKKKVQLELQQLQKMNPHLVLYYNNC